MDLTQERGPLTVAAFMDLALYDPEFGYYARAPQRSGRAGDFFTSVDVGPIFGELLEAQIAEMADLLTTITGEDAEKTIGSSASSAVSVFDLVEAGAGNGRLSADILRAAGQHHPSFFSRIRLHLVEAGAAPRAAQRATLGDLVDHLASSSGGLPASFEGVLIANELLDALPVHQVIMREDGLREVYVDVISDSGPAGTRARVRLATREGPPSTPELAEYLARLGVTLEPGWRAEINLRAVEWVRDAARRLRRGFIVLVDYGHEARELYSMTHADGTLSAFARHTAAGPESGHSTPPWLHRPGEQDITAHVDFTSVRAAGEAEGLTTIGFLDQTYFLLGLLTGRRPTGGGGSAAVSVAQIPDLGADSRPARALKTLLMPGGLGSTLKVLIFGKDVGAPALLGCSYRVRVT